MRFICLFFLAHVVWIAPALAGFEWIPPESNPSVVGRKAMPASPPATDKKDEQKPKMEAENTASTSASASDMIDRIFDYESGRISALKMKEQRAEYLKSVKAREDQFMQTQTDILREANGRQIAQQQSGMLPMKVMQKGQAAKASAPSRPTDLPEKPLHMLLINPIEKPVVGFGSHVPLALAINDIVPDHYSFSFADHVNPGSLVSWEGRHRPWHLVLQEVLTQQNLSGTVQGKVIRIKINPAYEAIMRASNGAPTPMYNPAAPYGRNASPVMEQAKPKQRLVIDPMPIQNPVVYQDYSAKPAHNSVHNSAQPFNPISTNAHPKAVYEDHNFTSPHASAPTAASPSLAPTHSDYALPAEQIPSTYGQQAHAQNSGAAYNLNIAVPPSSSKMQEKRSSFNPFRAIKNIF